MRRSSSIFLSLFIFSFFSQAQTLLTYGAHTVDAKEFLRAYQRNNTDSVSAKEVSMRAYLDLYVLAKMKVREAYVRRYDTLSTVQQEVDILRKQLLDKYLADPVLLERLKLEAFQRSQTDREVAHLFISFRNPNRELDSARAYSRKVEVEKKLGQGQDFFSLANAYSDDPAVGQNQGRIGYLTVFSLPYEMETAIYQTPVGKNSAWIRSNKGFHLFRVLSERPAVGIIRVKQILLAIPPGAAEAEKRQIHKLADSLYQSLKKGADFGELAKRFSNDNISAASGGKMEEFGVGQYDPLFEQSILSLDTNNSISAPFATAYGWHIVQRVSVVPPSNDFSSSETQQALEQKIRYDDRWRGAKDFIYDQLRTKAGARRTPYQESALWQFADSLLDRKSLTAEAKTIDKNTALFTIGRDLSKKIYTVGDWIEYATNFRYQPDGSGFKPHAQVRNEWEQYVMVEYYEKNLESFNDEFRNQLTEFRDGNLFFEIMQREVWDKAQSDTAAQHRLFAKQSDQYTWKPSAEVILFFCSDVSAAKELYARLKANPSNWKKESLSFGERVFFDSTRMEWGQIPNLGGQQPLPGQLLEPAINQTDNTATLTYIRKVYPQPGPKTFEEARGSVISDLQTELEKKWDVSLRKKYPLKINEKVFSLLLK